MTTPAVPVLTRAHVAAFNNATELSINPVTEEIAEGAFREFLHLESVDLRNVKRVGIGAFERCAKLARVEFGSKLTSVEMRAFSGTALKRFTLPDTVHTVGESAFADCGSDNVNFRVPAGMKLIGYKAFQRLKAYEIIIPPSVALIKTYAFELSDVYRVVFEGEDYWIDHRAFMGSGIKRIDLSRAQVLGGDSFDDPFDGCRTLSHVVLPRIRVLGGRLFQNCLISDVILPDEVQVIDRSCFMIRRITMVVGTDKQVAQLYTREAHRVVQESPSEKENTMSATEWAAEMDEDDRVGGHSSALRLCNILENFKTADDIPSMILRVYAALGPAVRDWVMRHPTFSDEVRDHLRDVERWSVRFIRRD